MLSTFLSQLQTYFSKYFVLGSFCPVLAFAFLNGATAYFVSLTWRNWAGRNILHATAGHEAFLVSSLIVGLVLAAYVLSALSTFLRRQLEGSWPDAIASWFIPAQNRRRQQLIEQRNNASMDLANLAYASRWEQQMLDARLAGIRDHPGQKFEEEAEDEVDDILKDLQERRAGDKNPDSDDLEDCASKISRRLREYDANASPQLEAQQAQIISLIDYAHARSAAEKARLQNELNSNFGKQRVAPTKMGNVANTIQGYALRRYHCNFEIIWSNMQRLVQQDEKSNAALLESKTQLDFLVSCCWLTLLWSAVWAVAFLGFVPSRPGFLLAALGGPLLAYVWYRAAAEQYRSFADIAMTTFDAFRLDLLKDMRLHVPADVEEERYMWENIDHLTTYGEDTNFRYEPPPAKTP
ncbi:MAG: hypothetical protein ACLP59_24860 [Bryobacteraceae bacterium]